MVPENLKSQYVRSLLKKKKKSQPFVSQEKI